MNINHCGSLFVLPGAAPQVTLSRRSSNFWCIAMMSCRCCVVPCCSPMCHATSSGNASRCRRDVWIRLLPFWIWRFYVSQPGWVAKLASPRTWLVKIPGKLLDDTPIWLFQASNTPSFTWSKGLPSSRSVATDIMEHLIVYLMRVYCDH